MMVSMGSANQLWRRAMTLARTVMTAAAVAGAIAIACVATATVAIAQNYTVDTAASEALANYLRQNRLPLVGAQIGTASTGARRLVLFGYVATQQGKIDAESKSVAYLGNPQPELINRIVIKPEIANMRSAGQSGTEDSSPGAGTGSVGDYAGGAPAGAFPGQSFDKTVDDIQRYGIKSPPAEGAQ
jgi:hypothetical protein